MTLQQGCLALADIGGYTKYVSGVELEHSHDILADLIGTVTGRLTGNLQLAKLEGDAIFCIKVDSGDMSDGPAMLDLIEQCYFAFQRKQRTIVHLNTCDCNACIRIPDLDLKFLVHFGQFMAHEVAGLKELVGRDVILVHRLLKNSVIDRTGLKGYALYTRSFFDHFQLDPAPRQMLAWNESYEDMGEIEGWLEDLEAAWELESNQNAVYFGPGETPFEVSAILPGRPEEVWELATSPHKRPLWQTGVTRVDTVDPDQPMGPGTVNHCVHGDHAIKEEILSWRPFEYLSLRWHTPVGKWVGTLELTPAGPDIVRLSVRARAESDDPVEIDAFQQAVPGLEQAYGQGLEKMGSLLKHTTSAQPVG